jgi:hypothetical protein
MPRAGESVADRFGCATETITIALQQQHGRGTRRYASTERSM